MAENKDNIPTPTSENNRFKGLREGIRDHGGDVMRESSGRMAGILKTNKSDIVTHNKFGKIIIDAGKAKSRSYGIKHIINQRHDEKKSVKEISAILILLDTTLKNGKKISDIKLKRQPEHRGRMKLESGGIIAIVSKQRYQGDSEQWVLTGFDDKKNKEAAESIQKVISRYGYAPEFLDLEKQVGAVVSSLQISHQSKEKSREIETARKAGYVQGVCECVAAIGDAIGEDHALGKKLLTEMNVNKETAKKYANPETFKKLEKGIFAPRPEQKQEQSNTIKR
jgi:hypothetical protein